MKAVLEGITNAGVSMPMSLPPNAVPADISHNTAGLPEADFGKLVATSSFSMAGIGTFAHQIIVFQANDASSAAEIKRIVSSDGGYDPKKWICVYPEKVIAVDSGSYVLLAASYSNVCDAAVEAFKEATGGLGSVITFWEFSDD